MHKASLVLFAGLLFVSTATAQDGAIPMNNSRWEAPPNAVEFTTHEGTPAARILDGSASLTLRNADFSNGTITFDVALEDAGSLVRFTIRYAHRRWIGRRNGRPAVVPMHGSGCDQHGDRQGNCPDARGQP